MLRTLVVRATVRGSYLQMRTGKDSGIGIPVAVAQAPQDQGGLGLGPPGTLGITDRIIPPAPQYSAVSDKFSKRINNTAISDSIPDSEKQLLSIP